MNVGTPHSKDLLSAVYVCYVSHNFVFLIIKKGTSACRILARMTGRAMKQCPATSAYAGQVLQVLTAKVSHSVRTGLVAKFRPTMYLTTLLGKLSIINTFILMDSVNRRFPSCISPLFQSES